MKQSVKTDGVQARIRTEHLPTTLQSVTAKRTCSVHVGLYLCRHSQQIPKSLQYVLLMVTESEVGCSADWLSQEHSRLRESAPSTDAIVTATTGVRLCTVGDPDRQHEPPHPKLHGTAQSLHREPSHSASQAISRALCSPRFHYHVHKRPPLVPLLSHIQPPYLFYILPDSEQHNNLTLRKPHAHDRITKGHSHTHSPTIPRQQVIVRVTVARKRQHRDSAAAERHHSHCYNTTSRRHIRSHCH
jgi:hypothetical protein